MFFGYFKRKVDSRKRISFPREWAKKSQEWIIGVKKKERNKLYLFPFSQEEISNFKKHKYFVSFKISLDKKGRLYLNQEILRFFTSLSFVSLKANGENYIVLEAL